MRSHLPSWIFSSNVFLVIVIEIVAVVVARGIEE